MAKILEKFFRINLLIVLFLAFSATHSLALDTPSSITYPSSDSDGNFTVSWSSVSGGPNYQLWRSQDSDFSPASAVYNGPNTSYNEIGLANGTYYYRVLAYNDTEASGWRSGGAIQVGNVPPSINVTQPSSNMTVTQGDSVTIAWDGTDPDDAALVHIYYDPDQTFDNGNDVNIVAGRSEDGSYSWNTSAVPPGQYYVGCLIQDSQNYSHDYASGRVTISAGNVPPSINVTQPSSNMTVTQGDSVTIAWDGTDPDDAALVHIYYDPDQTFDNGNDVNIVAGRSEDGSYSWNTSAVPPGQYYVGCLIQDSQNYSHDYASGRVTIGAVCSKPSTPSSITYPSTDSDGNFTVSWSSVSGSPNYQLWRSQDSDFSPASVVYNGPNTFYGETSLANGTYYYRVIASNDCGASDWRSGGAIIVGCSKPSTPSSITYPSTDSDGNFTVSWSSVSGSPNYQLWRSQDSDFSPAHAVYIGPNTSYDEIALANGTYYYRVLAYNDCDASDWRSGSAIEIAGNVMLTIDVTKPSSDLKILPGDIVEIKWNGASIDADSRVELFYDTDTSMDNGGWTLIAGGQPKNGSYSWDTSSLSSDTYYIIGVISDGNIGANIKKDIAPGTVTVDDFGECQISDIQINRIPAVIPLDYASTIPLTFVGTDNAGKAPSDRGPLSLTARISNFSNSECDVKLKVESYTDPEGIIHTKLLGTSYDESNNGIWAKIGPNSHRDLSVYLRPVKSIPGVWSSQLFLHKNTGVLSSEKIDSRSVEFTVKRGDIPTVDFPRYEMDTRGVVCMPEPILSQSDNIFYVIAKNLDTIAELYEISGSVASSYQNYYENLSDLLGKIRSDAFLKVTSELNQDGDRIFYINWKKLWGTSSPIDYDRAVITAIFPDGMSSTDIVDSGTAHVLEGGGLPTALVWYINAADKRINSKQYDWLNHDLRIVIDENALHGEEVKFILELQLGPFANNRDQYEELSEAPWVYNYNKWFTNPEDVFWYDISVTDPNIIINNDNPVPVKKILDNVFIGGDNSVLFLPFDCFSNDKVISWKVDNSPPSIPPDISIIGSAWEFSAENLMERFDKYATIVLPLSSSIFDVEKTSIYRYNSTNNEWEILPSIIDADRETISAKTDSVGIFAAFVSERQVIGIPPLVPGYPSQNAEIQQGRISFMWSDSSGGEWQYDIEISDNEYFISPTIKHSTSEPVFTAENILDRSSYYWRVRRIDAAGTVGDWSSERTFLIIDDTTPPRITNYTPMEGAIINEKRPIISAEVVDDETGINKDSIILEVDEKSVFCILNQEGQVIYTPEADLSPGEHTVNIEASDNAGNYKSDIWTFTISSHVNNNGGGGSGGGCFIGSLH